MWLPASPTDVCNIANDHMRQPHVANVDDPTTTEEEILSRAYDLQRRAVLEKAQWNFATAEATIPLAAPAPTVDYTDKYILPSDYLKLRYIGGFSVYERVFDYDIRENYILCNNGGAGSLDIVYVKDITDVSKWPATALNVLALEIALKTVYQFTGRASEVERIFGLVQKEWPDALSKDGQERPPRRVQYSKYMAARRGYISSNNPGLYDPN